MKSENINELAAALAKAQSEMGHAVFDKVNPHFKSAYASLKSCWDAARPALTKNGLSVSQIPEKRNTELVLVTTLMHTSGQWLQGEMPISGATPQQQGSALSYVRRYSLSSMLGIVADEDDDGNGAEKKAPAPKALEKKVEAKEIEARFLNEENVASKDYVVTFGKLKGKRLGDIPLDELKGYVNWILEQATIQNRPVTGLAAEFMRHTEVLMGVEAHKDSDIEVPF